MYWTVRRRLRARLAAVGARRTLSPIVLVLHLQCINHIRNSSVEAPVNKAYSSYTDSTSKDYQKKADALMLCVWMRGRSNSPHSLGTINGSSSGSHFLKSTCDCHGAMPYITSINNQFCRQYIVLKAARPK